VTHRNIRIIQRLKIIRSEVTAIINELHQEVQEDVDRKYPEKPAKRACALPEDFKPRPEDLEWALLNYPEVDHERETEKFENYWIGTGGAKKDWHRTWRNWIIQADGYLQRDGGRATRRSTTTAKSNRAKADRVAARFAERTGEPGAAADDPFEIEPGLD
jgi:hypothetical protein